MKKPRYIESIYRYLFLIIGLVFFLLTILIYIGILTPSSKSAIQDQNQFFYAFLVITFILSILSNIFYQIIVKKDREKHLLIEQGVSSNVMVEDVYIDKRVRFIKQSPYRVKYSYVVAGNRLLKKSNLLWEKPSVNVGQTIEAFVLNKKSLLKIETE